MIRFERDKMIRFLRRLHTLKRVHAVGHHFGIDPVQFIIATLSIPRFLKAMLTYRRAWDGGRFPLRISHLRPLTSDWLDTAGVAEGHYFHQDLWAARKVFEARPKQHIDIGSRIDGFVAHILTFMPITVIDVRALESNTSDLTFVKADATSLSEFANGSVASLSSLHAVEHFGLGRFGDPVDPSACFKAMKEMVRILAEGGGCTSQYLLESNDLNSMPLECFHQ